MRDQFPGHDPVVIVFKPKDRRQDSTNDKTQILRSLLGAGRDLQFFEAGAVPLGGSLPVDAGPGQAIDIDDFDTPIVCARLTPSERARVEAHPDVEIVEDDDIFVYSGIKGPGAFRIEGQPTLDKETIPAGVAQVFAPMAWGNTLGKGIRVAILDTGIDSTHPDLAMNVFGGANFVDGTPSDRDDEGHGTFCAGIIGAAITGSGIVGVAPSVSMYSVKVSDQTAKPTLRSIIAGIDWCIRNNMHVVNMSFGYPEPHLSLDLMCRRAWKSGLLLVASAGNDSGRVCYPAALDSVVAVGAIDQNNGHYPQSNIGPELDLCAPGVRVMSTGLGGAYHSMSGTSASAPHVAGAAALAWGAHRFATNAEIWNLLAATARYLGDRRKFGLGRVNALAASSAMVPPPATAISGHSLTVDYDDEAGRRTARPVNGPTRRQMREAVARARFEIVARNAALLDREG